MKNLKSLQALALAGVAVALTAGCSSTNMGQSDTDSTAAYRFASSSGWTPITDTRQLGKFPLEWNPVSYESYRFEVPAESADQSMASAETPQFNENLQPGDTFVEAAGASQDSGQVKRVIKYTPFASAGFGR